MSEFINGLMSLSQLEVTSDIHGALAMLGLFLFGVSLVSFLAINKFTKPIKWLKASLILLLVDLALLDVFGLIIYAPYRAKGGARDTLLASADTAWLHKIIFEHKEFLAFGPLILIAVSVIIVFRSGDQLKNERFLKTATIFSILASLIFVAVVASEAVLVAKTVPLR